MSKLKPHSLGELIFYNADGSEIMRSENISEASIEPNESSDPNGVIKAPQSIEGELRFNGHIDTKVVLSLLTGMKITNNWLKLHGGVIERKSYKKYGKKKRNRRK